MWIGVPIGSGARRSGCLRAQNTWGAVGFEPTPQRCKIFPHPPSLRHQCATSRPTYWLAPCQSHRYCPPYTQRSNVNWPRKTAKTYDHPCATLGICVVPYLDGVVSDIGDTSDNPLAILVLYVSCDLKRLMFVPTSDLVGYFGMCRSRVGMGHMGECHCMQTYCLYILNGPCLYPIISCREVESPTS